MNFETLKQDWHASVRATPTRGTMESLTQQARAGARHYQRAVRLRTVYGVTAFGLALALLGVLWMQPGVWTGMRVALLLWSAGLVACAAGLFRLWTPSPAPADSPLQLRLQASLQHVQREMAYFRSLRWRWWLPFGLGLASALIPRLSAQPDLGWLVGLFAGLACAWGFVRAGSYRPRQLDEQETLLRNTLAQVHAAVVEGEQA